MGSETNDSGNLKAFLHKMPLNTIKHLSCTNHLIQKWHSHIIGAGELKALTNGIPNGSASFYA